MIDTHFQPKICKHRKKTLNTRLSSRFSSISRHQLCGPLQFHAPEPPTFHHNSQLPNSPVIGGTASISCHSGHVLCFDASVGYFSTVSSLHRVVKVPVQLHQSRRTAGLISASEMDWLDLAVKGSRENNFNTYGLKHQYCFGSFFIVNSSLIAALPEERSAWLNEFCWQ